MMVFSSRIIFHPASDHRDPEWMLNPSASDFITEIGTRISSTVTAGDIIMRVNIPLIFFKSVYHKPIEPIQCSVSPWALSLHFLKMTSDPPDN